MQFSVIDFSEHWHDVLSEAIARWNGALALRGITLAHEVRGSAPCDSLSDIERSIVVCQGEARSDRLGYGTWSSGGGAWSHGRVWLYGPPDPQHPLVMMHVVLHELGHAMGLAPVPPADADGHMPAGSDSVMTTVPRLVAPSAWDAANALSGHPIPPPPPPAPPPPPVESTNGKKRKRRGRKKKGGRHRG
jgi:hypothetical protein